MNTPIVISSNDHRLMLVAANVVKGFMWDSRPLLDARSQHRPYFKTIEVYGIPKYPDWRIFENTGFNVIHFNTGDKTPHLGTPNTTIGLPHIHFEELDKIATILLKTVAGLYPGEYLNKPLGMARGLVTIAAIRDNVDNTLCGVTASELSNGYCDPTGVVDLNTLGELSDRFKLALPDKYCDIKLNPPDYRLGDLLGVDDERLTKLMLSNEAFRDTIGYEYASQVSECVPLELITSIVKRKCNEYSIPIANNLVTHIRLSDLPMADFTCMRYIKQLMLALERYQNCTVTILVGIHRLDRYSKKALVEHVCRDVCVLNAITEHIESAGMRWKIQSSTDIDYDFCVGCAGIMVPSSGGFSEWMARISEQLHRTDAYL